ncbi:protein translocase subunit SecD [Candidatus Pantoea edessiphila]|uniref:Protein translocase subunit SecD n=1 Tax=Candidatus Pantoea edessiphila TaxID=2044610 RepID=A0A2P5SXK4_9GAMM|nr:protein translocase subunit SecD [Candidatus Pantoea edessiphila]MBK4775861.1 protein translocase subunit SecD [Pantoea sp. Edef]PPI87030.1 protein translocase subunit SecD [Candidatus Pantoea edessiphila]
MLNRYPRWKYIVLFTVTFISLLYALPNLYGEDPAIQITGKKGSFADQQSVDLIKNTMNDHSIKYKLISMKNGVVTVCFDNIDIQLLAKDIITKRLGEKYITALNLVPSMPRWLNWISARPMKLGFDLRGGVQFLIELDINNLIKKNQNHTINNLRDDLRKHNMPYNTIYMNKSSKTEINFKNFHDVSNALVYLRSHYNNLLLKNSNNTIIVSLTPSYINKLRENAIQQNIYILRNRINQIGISESSVQRQGAEYIIINIPGIQDTAHAKELIGTTATLELRLVNTNINPILVSKDIIPFDSEIKYMSDGKPVVLHKDTILTGDHITHSNSSIDEYGNPEVNITLDSVGGDIMSLFTKHNIGKFIATLFIEYKDSGLKDSKGHSILLKNEAIINIANIKSMVGSKFSISGIKNLNAARQLSILLRAGTLVTPIHIIEERIVGPSMGQQNIIKGFQACLCGLIACTIFMLLCYKIFGIISICALLINLIIIIGVTSILPGITLTMSGIAGIVLTLAVSIDANILINERIKEELYIGYSIQQAIRRGYQKALPSIIDSNITTLIKAVILYSLGTSSIKGFAIMTIIGIMTSMFTAVIGTRTIINLIYVNRETNRLSI